MRTVGVYYLGMTLTITHTAADGTLLEGTSKGDGAWDAIKVAQSSYKIRGWKYFLALLSGKLDEHADPKIQIQQAIEEAQYTHQRLTKQAAAVIGNQRQLEMKLARQMSEV